MATLRHFVRLMVAQNDQDLMTTMTYFVGRVLLYGFVMGVVVGILCCALVLLRSP
jgi:cytochrome bd-type quinol oxidase subunit 1